MDPRFLAFLLLATVLTVTPGPDMALVARNALGYGRRAAIYTALGVCAGLTVHAALSVAGLSVILLRSATLFEAVRLAGAAYLIFLGAQTLLLSFRRADAPARDTQPARTRSARSAGRAFREGVLSNLLNPKVALFYSTALPQFIAPESAVLPASLVLAATHIGMGLLWLAFYVYLLGRLSDVLARAGVRRTLERLTGVVLVALGLRLALTRR